MGLRFFRPTSSASRHTVLNSFKSIGSKSKILYSSSRSFGRNHSGVITCRHRGGGHKRLYRKVDFWRKQLNGRGFVKAIDYDPNRNARLALVYYENGEKSYILAPKGIRFGQLIRAGFRVPVEVGNALPLWNLPLGTGVHNVELYPGRGGRLVRSAGASAQLIAREGGFATIRLPSGITRLVPQSSWATVGQVGNVEARNKSLGKAGRIRWLGWRPIVRGSVINPVDHPHGGGEGRCPVGRIRQTNLWGKPRLGVKTRRSKKYSDIFILRRKKLLFSSVQIILLFSFILLLMFPNFLFGTDNLC